jgi:N-acetylglucosamine-6-phosphate deacetylase
MDEAVRFCVTTLGVDLGETLRMASLYPAQFLRVDHDLGRMGAGFRANLVHLTDALAVTRTWIDGEASPL